MKNLLLSLLIFSIGIYQCNAQDSGAESTIYITGITKKTIKPDWMTISIEISQVDMQFERVNSELDNKKRKILEFLKGLGIGNETISVTKNTIGGVVELYNEVRFKGQLGIKLETNYSESILEKIYERLFTTQSERYTIVLSVSPTEMESVQIEMTKSALQNAESRAESLASLKKFKLGKIVSLSNFEAYQDPVYMEYNYFTFENGISIDFNPVWIMQISVNWEITE
jgi:uncharacterized protein YggE